jgi:hypothetical protein
VRGDEKSPADRNIDAILSSCRRFVDGLVSISDPGAWALARWYFARKEALDIKVGHFRGRSADSAGPPGAANQSPWVWF